MPATIKVIASVSTAHSLLILGNKKTSWKKYGLKEDEISYITNKIKAGETYTVLNQFNRHVFIQLTDEWKKKASHLYLEELRGTGNKVSQSVNANRYEKIQITGEGMTAEALLAAAEGCILGSYEFLKYKSDKSKPNTLQEVLVTAPASARLLAERMNILTDAVYQARDLVNEPQSYLDAVTFSDEIRKMGKKAGFRTEILNKKQIQALKMGGLLAVNMGSKIPPTFSIMEWKPKGAKNKKPIVLIGKGVVYDTGGLSLKPTPNSMDTMKCDMAGGAAVAATLYAIAKAGLPCHVIGLVPATDNRPGEDAYTPGDVVTMYDGKTVEVLNTDAEGRMLLADALAYASKYKPELVLDFATLTGAASAAIGPYGMVCMGTVSSKVRQQLMKSGDAVYERLVEFPFWDEYAKLIKSDLADMKNIGGPVAGAITAGKFLEKFTDYPWMHFDIAGPAFIASADSYRGKQATGYAVRFLFHFISQLSK